VPHAVVDPHHVRAAAALPRPAIDSGLSLWLDGFRVGAALAVFFGHAVALGMAPANWPAGWHRSADDAVTLFFVLSGLLIAASTLNRRRGPSHYALARLSRLYSVVLPCLAAVLAMDTLGMHLAADLYTPAWQYPKLHLYLPFHLLFLGETWLGPIQPFSALPYWSLAYEAWYYLLFGWLVFTRGGMRWLGAVILCLLMGPAMLLLLPLWLLGVALHAWLPHSHLGRWPARVLLLALPVLYAAFVLSGARAACDAASAALYVHLAQQLPVPFAAGSSVHVLADLPVALLCALLLLAARHAALGWPAWLARVVRALAARSFTFYLLHYSTLLLCKALGLGDGSGTHFLLACGLTLAATTLLAELGERRRSHYAGVLQRLAGMIAALPRRAFGR
jgi:peptidoglycan/LPS O-acetylase OafA/YrhL